MHSRRTDKIRGRGGVLVSEATWDRLGGAFAGQRIGEVAVVGRRAAVVLHALTLPDG